jgi:hypothetical protein
MRRIRCFVLFLASPFLLSASQSRPEYGASYVILSGKIESDRREDVLLSIDFDNHIILKPIFTRKLYIKKENVDKMSHHKFEIPIGNSKDFILTFNFQSGQRAVTSSFHIVMNKNRKSVNIALTPNAPDSCTDASFHDATGGAKDAKGGIANTRRLESHNKIEKLIAINNLIAVCKDSESRNSDYYVKVLSYIRKEFFKEVNSSGAIRMKVVL